MFLYLCMKRTQIPNREPFKMEILRHLSCMQPHLFMTSPNLLQLYASKATLDPHSSPFCIPCWGVIHSGKSSSYLSSNTSLDLVDLEPSVESGGTASWLSQPFEDFSCRDSKRGGIKFQGKKKQGAWCLKWRIKWRKGCLEVEMFCAVWIYICLYRSYVLDQRVI